MTDEKLTKKDLEEVRETVSDIIKWFSTVLEKLGGLTAPTSSTELEKAVAAAGTPPRRGFDGRGPAGLYPNRMGGGCKVLKVAWPEQEKDPRQGKKPKRASKAK